MDLWNLIAPKIVLIKILCILTKISTDSSTNKCRMISYVKMANISIIIR